jgi:hypothetical protein
MGQGRNHLSMLREDTDRFRADADVHELRQDLAAAT